MMNLNDTISAFRCCTQVPPTCSKCPLTEMCKWNLSKDRCKNEVKLSVNHWLKTQEPRVMTLEEVQAHKIGDPLFYESRIIYPCWVIRLKDEKGRIHFLGYVGNIFKDITEYNVRWRCWTSRPTDAQREAEPWQGLIAGYAIYAENSLADVTLNYG